MTRLLAAAMLLAVAAAPAFACELQKSVSSDAQKRLFERRESHADALREPPRPCRIVVERIRAGAPAMMDGTFQDATEAASSALAGGKSLRMPSGAAHDAQVLATIMPAGMLFVPSIGGVSHHWTENTADADIVTGADVFVDTCRRLLTGMP